MLFSARFNPFAPGPCLKGLPRAGGAGAASWPWAAQAKLGLLPVRAGGCSLPPTASEGICPEPMRLRGRAGQGLAGKQQHYRLQDAD